MTGAKDAAQQAKTTGPVRVLARAGFAANGLIHILIGATAIAVAFGTSAQADQSGALNGLASTPGGIVLVWAVAVGLLALALWQVIAAFTVAAPDPKRKVQQRVKELAKAVAYGAVGVTAVSIGLGARPDSSESNRSLSAALLATPGGVFVVALIGAVIAGVGIGFIVIGAKRSFTKTLRVPSGRAGAVLVGAGVAGYLAKGIALVILGVLFLIAAFTSDPESASGLDGALKALLELPAGPVLLTAVGAGLALYGVFFFARARFERL